MSYLIFAAVVVAIGIVLGGAFVWLVSVACSFWPSCWNQSRAVRSPRLPEVLDSLEPTNGKLAVTLAVSACFELLLSQCWQEI